jgi:hypothetical protein
MKNFSEIISTEVLNNKKNKDQISTSACILQLDKVSSAHWHNGLCVISKH